MNFSLRGALHVPRLRLSARGAFIELHVFGIFFDVFFMRGLGLRDLVLREISEIEGL